MYKTFSSPNLRDNQSLDKAYNKQRASRVASPPADYGDHHQQQNSFFIIGDRVLVDKYRTGSVAYFGELDFSSGDWVGVVLDEPSGNHDGKIHGREYFHCAPQHGLFVRPTRLTRLLMASSSSPAPSDLSPSTGHHRTGTSTRGQLLKSPAGSTPGYSSSGRSTSESYYYDDDYRSPRTPSIENLERKLKSIKLNNKPTTTTTVQQQYNSQPAERMRNRQESEQAKSVFNFRPQRIQVDDYYAQSINDQDQLLRNRSASATNLYRATASSPAADSKLLDFSSKPLHLHDRVLVRSNERNGSLPGTLRFLGETQFATGEWAGVELDEPDGRNDGCVLGVRYFRCPDRFGIFVPASRVARLNPKADFAISSIKSTIKSPPPNYNYNQQQQHAGYSSGRSSSAASSSSYAMQDRYASATPSSVTSSPGTPSLYNTTNYQYNNNNNNNNQSDDNHSNYNTYTNRSSHSPYDDKYNYTQSTNLSHTRPRPTPMGSSTNHIERDYYSGSRGSDLQPNNYSTSSAYSSIGNFSSGSLSATRADNHNSRSPKFRESDLDNALRRYTTRRQKSEDYIGSTKQRERPQPKSIKYTFKSSKYDGNPIAMKTVQYD